MISGPDTGSPPTKRRKNSQICFAQNGPRFKVVSIATSKSKVLGGFLSHGGTPSHHLFRSMGCSTIHGSPQMFLSNLKNIFPYKPTSLGYLHLWTPPYFFTEAQVDMFYSSRGKQAFITRPCHSQQT